MMDICLSVMINHIILVDDFFFVSETIVKVEYAFANSSCCTFFKLLCKFCLKTECVKVLLQQPRIQISVQVLLLSGAFTLFKYS